MTIKIQVPPAPEVPSELPILRVVAPRWDPAEIRALSEKLGVRGDIEDRGAWYVVQDSRASLEIYRASSSFRFVREDIDGEGRNGAATQVDPRRAVALAERFLEDTGRPPATIDVQSVTELEVLSMAEGSREPTRTIGGLQVNFRLSVDGVPLVGPGGKIQVTIGNGNEISAAYRFWRDTQENGSARILPAEHALQRLTDSAMFSDLTDDRARAEVTGVELGYLCLPPTESQGMLLPVYRLRGSVSTEQGRYDFVVYVEAVELDESSAKAEGILQPRPSLLLA